MGRVFKAWDRNLRRHVALRILIHETAEYAHRLLREASAQARIDHENVCRIYDSGLCAQSARLFLGRKRAGSS